MSLMRVLLSMLLAARVVSVAADAPVLHPRASRLPFDHQGPFVTTGDGHVLCLDTKNALRSEDDGRSWKSSAIFAEPAKFGVSNERALLRTREGVIIAGWMNGVEKKSPKNWKWGDPSVSWKDFVLPTYTCRSTDDGKTWEAPVKLSDPWCGCIHSLIQMRTGRLVLVGQEIIPQWRHATVIWASDDLGKSWQRGDMLDHGIGAHDHAGSIEGSVIERNDGTLYMLLRTESGWLWEAASKDGLKWEGLKQSRVRSVTCCPQLARLGDGRIALLWNAPPRHLPTSGTSRAELSIAFSADEAATWSPAIVVAANYASGGRVSYPYLYERHPGEFWITTMQGGLRMRVAAPHLMAGEIPAAKARPAASPRAGGVIMFGDSTTAPRAGVKVYSERVQEALQGIGSTLSVYNAGVGGNTTRDAVRRFEKDVLVHKPRLVVVSFGINDSAVDVWKKPAATEPRVPLAEYLQNLRSLVSQARHQGAKVILMTANPLRWTSKLRELYGKPPYHPEADDGFESATLRKYNDAVRKLAVELRVPLVDVHGAYAQFAAQHQTTIDGLLLDGMHPNDLGHQLVSELLVPAIREAVR